MPAAIPAIAAVAGAAISADSSRSAANKQADAARDASAVDERIFNTTNAQNAPYRDRGNAAGNVLGMYLGLPQSQSQYQPSATNGGPNFNDYASLRASLAPAFTRTEGGMSGDAEAPGVTTIDEAGLNAAISQRMNQEQQNWASRQPAPTPNADASNPLYGSLLKPFTGQDLTNEPGYQFGLQEGTKNLLGSAAVRGGFDSGSTLKALQKWGTDYAGTKYGDAFNRDLSTKQNTFNMLSGVSGTGQVANQQSMYSGLNYANNVGNNIIGAGNARASGYLAQGNALQTGINGLAYQWGKPYGSSISNGELASANASNDPIGSLGSSKGWWQS